MSILHGAWLELAILVPLVGAVWVSRVRAPDAARKWSLLFSGVALACTLAAWWSFLARPGEGAVDSWALLSHLLGYDLLVVEELNAPLLSLTAFVFLLTAIATPRTKIRLSSFGWALASEAILLATFGCKESWAVIALLALGTLPPYFELRARGKPTRVFVAHMALFVGLMVAGWASIEVEGRGSEHTWLALVPLLVAVFIRTGIFPFHCWVTDLFEHTTFGTALLFVAPMPGAYAAVRLVLPSAPDWLLRSIGMISLFTALYAAGMALVQREVRRFFCYVFLSHAALVLVGMDTSSPIGLTGALCVWLSCALALTGFGLTLRALEARHGRLSLANFHGLGEYTPSLAVFFLLTGLTSLGFPGTFGFLGMEMLVDGAVQSYAYVGIAVVLVAAINGIAIVKVYFLLFTGTKPVSTVPLGIGLRERVAVLALALLILFGGLFPQPGVVSRHHAALEILKERGGKSPAIAEVEGPPTPIHWAE